MIPVLPDGNCDGHECPFYNTGTVPGELPQGIPHQGPAVQVVKGAKGSKASHAPLGGRGRLVFAARPRARWLARLASAQVHWKGGSRLSNPRKFLPYPLAVPATMYWG